MSQDARAGAGAPDPAAGSARGTVVDHDAVDWLSDAEAAAWMPLLAVVMWLPAALDVQLEKDAGITNYEYGVLATLSMQPGQEMRIRQLARMSNSTLPRLSRVLDRFTAQGWVVRQPDPDDGRSTLALLTPAGAQKVTATAPGHVARVRELVFDRLSPAQVRQLQGIATRIAEAAGPDGACASRMG